MFGFRYVSVTGETSYAISTVTIDFDYRKIGEVIGFEVTARFPGGRFSCVCLSKRCTTAMRVIYFFFSDGASTAFPTCLLYSAMSTGEQINSEISKSGGCKWRGKFFKPCHGSVYIFGS